MYVSTNGISIEAPYHTHELITIFYSPYRARVSLIPPDHIHHTVLPYNVPYPRTVPVPYTRTVYPYRIPVPYTRTVYPYRTRTVPVMYPCTVRVRYGYGTGTVRVRYGYGTGTVRVRYGYGTGTVRVRYGYGTGTVRVRYGYGMWERYVGMVRGYGTWVRYMGHLRGCGARVHVIKLAPAKCSSTDIVWDGLGWVTILGTQKINFAGIMLILRSHLLRQKVVGLLFCLPLAHVLPITFRTSQEIALRLVDICQNVRNFRC